jgi:protein-S-isoprenylcysteine O-methyltransferase Ste14
MFPFSKVTITIWLIFWLYWLISAFGSKKNARSNFSKFARVRLSIFILAIILLHFLNRQSYSFQNRIATNNQLVLCAGFILFLLGLMLAVWARLYLGKNWGMPMSEKQDPELVTSGPYRYIRHPIYSGILLAFLGSAVSSSIFWLIIFVISGTYFIYSAVMEERLMTHQFPKVYPSYKSRTKMLIPFLF